MLLVRYGWRFTPRCPENAHKAGSGERVRVFSSIEAAQTTFQAWHADAPSWDYWLIGAQFATPAQIRKSERYRLTRV